jgi:hypothetical protein
MRYLVLLVLFAAACGDDTKPAQPSDAGIDAAQVQPLAPCVDRPTDLPLPPTKQLPCELLPPGFVAR